MQVSSSEVEHIHRGQKYLRNYNWFKQCGDTTRCTNSWYASNSHAPFLYKCCGTESLETLLLLCTQQVVRRQSYIMHGMTSTVNKRPHYLCGFFSQFCMGRSSTYGVLHGTSLVMLVIGLGGSDWPCKLYNNPLPSGRGKKTDPWKQNNVLNEKISFYIIGNESYVKCLKF